MNFSYAVEFLRQVYSEVSQYTSGGQSYIYKVTPLCN